MTPQEVRQKILESLYEKRSEDPVSPSDLLTEVGVSEEILDPEIRYLEGKYLLEIMGKFMGRKYLNFIGLKIMPDGIDFIESLAEGESKHTRVPINNYKRGKLQSEKVILKKEQSKWPDKSMVRDISILVIGAILVGGSAPWWWTPTLKFLERMSPFGTSYDDPSRTIDGSIFDLVKRINQLPTDLDKSALAKEYSGLGTRINPRWEYGKIVNVQPRSNLSLVKIQSYEDPSITLICEFASRWDQKLSIRGAGDVAFWGRVNGYDIDKSSLVLSDCSLY